MHLAEGGSQERLTLWFKHRTVRLEIKHHNHTHQKIVPAYILIYNVRYFSTTYPVTYNSIRHPPPVPHPHCLSQVDLYFWSTSPQLQVSLTRRPQFQLGEGKPLGWCYAKDYFILLHKSNEISPD